jgi:hypothetical protein
MKGFNVVRNGNYTVGKLYNTVVCEVENDVVFCAHGGWVTMSTAKAIKKTLDEAGVSLSIQRKKGTLLVNNVAVNAESTKVTS